MPGKFDGDAFSRSDIMRRLADVERDLRALQTARRLEAAAIGAGGLRVHSGGRIVIEDQAGNEALVAAADGLTLTGPLRVVDADGAVVAQVGRLPDGTVGVAAIDPATGQLVNLSTLAFGMRSVTAFGIGTRNNIDYGNLTGIPAGPVVPNVPIGSTGRAIVILTALVTVQDDAGRSGLMSVEVSGASEIDPNDGWAHRADIGGTVGGQTISPRDSALHLFDGVLTPGLNTFTARYRTLTAGGNVQWISPNVTVIPY